MSVSHHPRYPPVSSLLRIAVGTVILPLVTANLPGEDVRSIGTDDRAYTIRIARRLADPIFEALSENRLHAVIPQRDWEITPEKAASLHTSPLQAFGRTLSGLAPWLALGADDSTEGKLRAHYIDLAVQGIINATDPLAADYMFARANQERIVHACYLAYPLLVAPDQLWAPLNDAQKANVLAALKTHRAFQPNESNWLLFSALLEATIWELSGECEFAPIEYAVTKHMEWYLGDGTYGDGPEFHWDYYNGYVIQPLLLEVLRVCQNQGHPLGKLLPQAKARLHRYAEVIEHQISPEGTFPVIGRSSSYRFALLQPIGYVGSRWEWTDALHPGSTRAALTTVIRRMMDAPGTFAMDGWLNAGVVGHQEAARDGYNYTGALYFCALGLAHLGLAPDHPFWTEPAGKWFQQRVWSGESIDVQYPFRENHNY